MAARALRAVRVQIALLLLLATFLALEASGIIPSDMEKWVIRLFLRYGLPAVAVISFIENLAGLNALFPGSVAILGAMALTAGNPELALYTFLCIFLPALAAHQINFAAGKISGNTTARSSASDDRKPWNRWLLFAATLWHPHFTAITSIAAGAEGMRYSSFVALFLPTFFAWNVLWGVTMYSLGKTIQEPRFSWIPVIAAYILIWLAWDIFKMWRATESGPQAPTDR